eukprot:CAMPEP_0184403614 /NCGR_PEP_ID=MMETSP0007-20130409/85509_1 /TAXON_ID=97485 /ORGANISM="Prymnesium parvum, Strain Texoma1" /LENGTH=73 /DNA_ID=CAMNT_0026759731 /DNA_START=891 /DNA_END=1112 /DNA_ORIENTATION=+
MMAFGCICTALTVNMWLTPSSTTFASAYALCVPVISTSTSSASRTVATPTVRAMRGTALMSPPKNLAFATTVS